MGYQHAFAAAAAAARNSELEVHGALLQHLYPTGNDVCSLSTNGLLLPADPNCSSSSPSNSTSSPPKLSALGPPQPPPPEQHPQFWDQTHSANRESLEHRFVQCQQHVPLPPSQTLLFHDHCSTEMLGSVAMLAPTMSQQLIADFPMQQPQEVSNGSEPVEDGRCNEDSREDNQTHQWDIKDVRLPNVTTFEPYDLWPNSSCRRVYSFTSERARRHQSRWAMQNTNNHNPHVLKKYRLKSF
ncbi:unnamed protein product [Dibothriocephalus latus]|uniref:GCM domain-containing protein n=1 Tax=Dibothriocephalus latus TaxID=60516 RepID=A0A3P7LUF1_DIBLA|nr:unnamed protein product [Dibothriocephalus latus]